MNPSEPTGDFNEDPFKNYRYEDPFMIADPFHDEEVLSVEAKGKSLLNSFPTNSHKISLQTKMKRSTHVKRLISFRSTKILIHSLISLRVKRTATMATTTLIHSLLQQKSKRKKKIASLSKPTFQVLMPLTILNCQRPATEAALLMLGVKKWTSKTITSA